MRTRTSSLVETAAAYMADCCARSSPPRVEELAALLGVAPHTLNAASQTQIHSSVGHYLKHLQIAHAQNLLRVTSKTTTEVAYAAAFSTRRTFYRAFLRMAGCTPAAYRRNVRKCP